MTSSQPSDATSPTTTTTTTTAGACEVARKKLAECALTPAQTKTSLGDPCDERVAACIVGQGCEAIRKNETGCVFH